MDPNLGDQTDFRLNGINEIKDYFIAKTRGRELKSKRLSKYIAAFHYVDKSLVILSATSGGVSIALFTSLIGASVGLASASFSFAFSLTSGITKKLLKTTWNKTQNHNNIVMLAKRKLNTTESTISKPLIENEISHEDFTTITNEERNYRELKESIRIMKS